MKRCLNVLVVLVVLMLVFAHPAAAAAATEVQQANIIETSATGVVDVDPDLVKLTLAVVTEESSGALAEQTNAIAVKKAIDLLTSEGLTKDEIKTTNYSTYSYLKKIDEKESRVYSTNSGLEVTFQELNKVGEILADLATIVEVNVNSVNYSIQDPEKYKEQVISSAIAGAKENILYSAKALDLELDKLVYLKLDFTTNSNPQPYVRGTVAAPNSSIPQPQNPDKITITATATMSYSVK